ncbi:MAG TPA: hypothetical protein VEB21_11750 [Terriglobales bacterium]|nr:hypothetical protein [Terriglobales bacterium]
MAELLGIRRERVYSPGRVADDAAILDAVAEELRRRAHLVTVIDGDDASWPEPSPLTIVFAMAQGPRALERMQRWQERGVRIVNAPEAILNCQRHRTVPLLQSANVGLPETRMIATAAPLPDWPIGEGLWIKRGDVHATEAGDVQFARSAGAVAAAVAALRQRGVASAALQRHVAGEVRKFYGVASGFFHCVPPASGPAPDSATLARMGEIAQRAAAALGVEVYGGDCVLSPAGTVHIIDLNDWPSYRACRVAAAAAIASYLVTPKRKP